jgi:ABC-type nitrate/sulfonate/bicarbonate transport system substrate-binding protein
MVINNALFFHNCYMEDTDVDGWMRTGLRRFTMKTKILLALLLLIITGVVVFFALLQFQPSINVAPVAPAYDKYDYGRADEAKIIDVGTQPNTVNSTFLTEYLFRDRILQQQLAAEGWKLREHRYRSGNDMLPYTEGHLDVMILGDIPALISMLQYNIGIFAVAAQSVNAVITNRRVVPSELKGMRIGYPPKTSAHFTLERALHSAGLSMNDIVSVPLDPAETEPSLQSNSVDAVAIWPPFITAILENVPGSTVVSSSNTYNYIGIDLGFAERHPDVMKAVLAAVVRQVRWSRLDEANLYTGLLQVRQAQIRFSGKSVVDANEKWISWLRKVSTDNASFPMLPLDFSDEQGLQHQQFDFLKKIGILPPDAEWKSLLSHVKLRDLPEIINAGKTWQIDRFDYAPDKLYQDKEVSP